MITIRPNQADYTRYISAVNAMKRTAIREAADLPYRQALGYADFLRKRIASGKISHPRYSDEYAKFKFSRVMHLRPWLLTGALLESITTVRGKKNEWFGGIPNSVYAPRESMFGGKTQLKPIAMYAKTLEFGISPQKKRPVVVPAFHDYKPGAKREVLETKKRLLMTWR